MNAPSDVRLERILDVGEALNDAMLEDYEGVLVVGRKGDMTTVHWGGELSTLEAIGACEAAKITLWSREDDEADK